LAQWHWQDGQDGGRVLFDRDISRILGAWVLGAWDGGFLVVDERRGELLRHASPPPVPLWTVPSVASWPALHGSLAVSTPGASLAGGLP